MKKRLIYIAASLMAAGVMVSCHKITVKATSELTPDTYPLDSASYITATGPVYVALRGNVAAEYFFFYECLKQGRIEVAFFMLKRRIAIRKIVVQCFPLPQPVAIPFIF